MTNCMEHKRTIYISVAIRAHADYIFPAKDHSKLPRWQRHNGHTNGLPPGLGNWIIPTPEAVNEMVPTIEPQPDLESTVVVPHPGWFLQHPSPLHGIRA